MTTESKKLQTTLVNLGDHMMPMLKRKPEDGRRIIRQREERVALLNDARIAHEQREVIRKLVDACARANRHAVVDGVATRYFDRSAAKMLLEALAAAAPFLED